VITGSDLNPLGAVLVQIGSFAVRRHRANRPPSRKSEHMAPFQSPDETPLTSGIHTRIRRLSRASLDNKPSAVVG
jgi:hypothetical protein